MVMWKTRMRAALMVMALVLAESTCTIDRPTVDPTTRPGMGISDRSSEGVFTALRERDLSLPEVAPGQCPLSGAIHLPGIPAEAGLGPGTDAEGLDETPVYVVFQAIPRILDLFPPTRNGWRSTTILVASRPGYLGPVLIRGARLRGRGGVAFGPIFGRERELRLPAGPWDDRAGPVSVWGRTAHPRPGWRVAVAKVWMRKGDCYGLQMDGRSFGYPITFATIWQR
jgi:hypothetical protein